MRVLVAGCGWLGREVARRLAARGDRVSAIVRTAESAERLRADGIDARAADLAAPGAAEALAAGAFEGMIATHAAAGPGAAAYRAAYVDGTRALLIAAAATASRLVVTGSTGVFGRGDGSWVTEATPPDPTDETGIVLCEAERSVLDAAASGAHATIVRCSGLYGPGRAGLIDRVRSGAIGIGDGDDAWMNFCHRDDAAATLLAALDRGRRGAIYHASDAHPATRREVALWIAGRLGIEPVRRAAPRPGRGANRRIDAAATRRELGVTLAYPSYRDGLGPLLPA